MFIGYNPMALNVPIAVIYRLKISTNQRDTPLQLQ